MNKVAVITGVTGQIGSYMLDLLMEKGEYSQIFGIARRVSVPNTYRIKEHLDNPKFKLLSADITDYISLQRLFNFNSTPGMVKRYSSDFYIEIYNFAAQSFVKTSFDEPAHTFNATTIGALNIFEIAKNLKEQRFNVKLYNAASSEMYGSSIGTDQKQNDTIPFLPNSPYAVAKLAAHHLARIYRQSYGLYINSGIVFNTESPRRGEEFVTRKITKWFAEKFLGLTDKPLTLGNVTSVRDWTHAKDTVRAIHLIMQQDGADDYIISSGESHTIMDFINTCKQIKVEDGHGEVTVDIRFSQEFARPNDVPFLCGDASKIRALGWKPEISFKELVRDMVDSDIDEKMSHNSPSIYLFAPNYNTEFLK